MELNPAARLSYLMTSSSNIGMLIYRKLADTGVFFNISVFTDVHRFNRGR